MEKKIKKRKIVNNWSYVNGIVDDNGDQVIRPLTEAEKAYLYKFNNEFENASFNNDSSDIHYNMITSNKEKVEGVKSALKEVLAEIRKFTHGEGNGYREMSGVERLEYKKYRKDLFNKKNELVQELEKIDTLASIDNAKNSRRRDVSNSDRTSFIGDLASGNFTYIDGESNRLDNSLESTLFDRLKNAPLVED